MRWSWLPSAAGVAMAVGSCSVYGNNLVGTGGSSSASSSTSVSDSASTSSTSGAGGAGGTGGAASSGTGTGGHGGVTSVGTGGASSSATTSSTTGAGGLGGAATTTGSGGMTSTASSTSAASSTSSTSTASSTTTSAASSTTTSAASSTSTSAASSTSTTTSSSSSGGGCGSAGDCPGVTTDCQAPVCTSGVCGTAFTAAGTPTSTQTPGDCATMVCDGAGNTTSQVNNADPPTSTNPCTTGACSGGVSVFPPTAVRSPCNQGGGTLCDGDGSCVGCLDAADCPSMVCTVMSTCAAASCTDQVKNESETDVDCGGACPPCPLGDTCQSNADCKGQVCTSGTCAASCTDTTRDGSETDVDCGGPACSACPVGKTCSTNGDCQTGRCAGGVCADGLVFSQIQTRGVNGGNDEFVEIYNPGSVAVTFDNTWAVKARSAVGTCTANSPGARFNGAGQVIPAHGHLLYANPTSPGYSETRPADATYTTGITDASNVLLFHGSTLVDALCFYFDTTTQTALLSCSSPYTCAGAPIMNPHDNTTGTNTDASLERKPGGSLGNTQNTGDNSADFASKAAADPHDLASTPVP